ncbi:MAG: hypothetical protein ABIW76_13165 [Fibrobacteria bacterium]
MNTVVTGGFVFVVILAFLVVLFLVFRELVMWYWKINEINKNLLSLNIAQNETNRILSTMAAGSIGVVVPAETGSRVARN